MGHLHQGTQGSREDRKPAGRGRIRREPRRPALSLGALRRDHALHGGAIRERLAEFAGAGRAGDEAIFKELCFCILAANSSAEMGVKTLSRIGDLVWSGDLAAMQGRLAGGGFRYWRVRPAYIVSTREHLRRLCGLRLKDWLESFEDAESRRDALAADRGIKGIGYKEASHFLRNVGYKGYAILDKHILNCLRELGVIGDRLRPAPARRYKLIERRMRLFAGKTGIDMDELDLLLWRHKTGKILK